MNGVIQRVRQEGDFGFLRGDGEQEDRFFHRSNLRAGLAMSQLKQGTRVSFDPTVGPKGLRAEAVRAADEALA